MTVWIWVLIPLAGIALGGFSEWLKFKERQAEMGRNMERSSHEAMDRLSEVIAAQESIIKRLENLETIVTSPDWDAVQQEGLLKPRIEIPEDEYSLEQKTSNLAKRVRT